MHICARYIYKKQEGLRCSCMYIYMYVSMYVWHVCMYVRISIHDLANILLKVFNCNSIKRVWYDLKGQNLQKLSFDSFYLDIFVNDYQVNKQVLNSY